MDARSVIIRPVVSEKSYDLIEGNVYTFVVHNDANKTQIRQAIEQIFGVPDELELMAVYRLGYLPPEQRRPAIDWSSHQRKLVSQYVFRDSCATPQQGWDDVGQAPR